MLEMAINTLLQPVRDSDMEFSISSVNAFETNSMLQGPIQDGITHTGTQDSQVICWHDACIKTLARAARESWTEQDIKSAFLQLNLLSYSDVLDPSDTSLSSVEFLDYKHNCPWNDWIPPSKSVLRQVPNPCHPPSARARASLRLARPSVGPDRLCLGRD